jgi:hypothetical protein
MVRQDPLVARLRLVRRRMALALVLRHASTGALTGALAAVAVPQWVFGCLTGGAAIGLIVASFRLPSIAAAARTLDRQFHLSDRLITCLEIVDKDDVMSRLVLDDAWNHIGSIAPGSLAPLPVRWASAAAAAAVFVIALGTWPDVVWPERADRERVAISLPVGAAPRSRVDDASNLERVDTTDAGNAAKRDSRNAQEDQIAGQNPGQNLNRPRLGTDEESRDSRIARNGYSGTASSETGTGASVAGVAAQLDSAPAAPGAAQGGGRAMVGAGTSMGLRGSHDRVTVAPPARDFSAVAPVDRIEAALPRDEVPVGLRRYVMDYFLAITR